MMKNPLIKEILLCIIGSVCISCNQPNMTEDNIYKLAEIGEVSVGYTLGGDGLMEDTLFINEGESKYGIIQVWEKGELKKTFVTKSKKKIFNQVLLLNQENNASKETLGAFCTSKEKGDTIYPLSQKSKEFFISELGFWLEKDTLNKTESVIQTKLSYKNYCIKPLEIFAEKEVFDSVYYIKPNAKDFYLYSFPKILGDNIAFATKIRVDSINRLHYALPMSDLDKISPINRTTITEEDYNKLKLKFQKKWGWLKQ